MDSISKELRKYKKLLIAYTALCIITAVFVSPFFGVPHLNRVMAYGEDGSITAGEVMESTANDITFRTMKKIAGSYAPIIGSCAEPFSAMLFIGVIDCINRYGNNNFLDLDPTFLGLPPVLAVVFIFFIASKIMRGNAATKIAGFLTLGELEKYLGLIFCIIIGILNIFNVGINFSFSTVSAAGLGTTILMSTANFIKGVGLLTFSVLMSVGSVIIYIIVRTALTGIDALQSCFAFIPLSSAVFEVIKTVFAIGITVINIKFPEIAIVIDLIIFVICLLIFRFCFRVEEFVRKIYLKPFIARIKGFNDEIPLISTRIPKKIRKFIEKDYGTVNLAIPGFAFKKKEADGFKMKFMQKVWVVSTETETFFVARKAFGKLQKYQLSSRSDDKMYFMKRDFRFIELFSNPVGKRLSNKDLRVIISVEYTHRFDEIVQILGITDYHEHVKNTKLTKKEERREKRERRKEALKEKSNNFSQNIVDFFSGKKDIEDNLAKSKENDNYYG